jgi:hypothetical protein
MTAFIDDHREAYRVGPICRILPIARTYLSVSYSAGIRCAWRVKDIVAPDRRIRWRSVSAMIVAASILALILANVGEEREQSRTPRRTEGLGRSRCSLDAI